MLKFIANVENRAANSLRIFVFIARHIVRFFLLHDMAYNVMLIYREAIEYALVTSKNTNCFYDVF